MANASARPTFAKRKVAPLRHGRQASRLVRRRASFDAARVVAGSAAAPAAYLTVLGQIELVLTFAASIFLFHERPNRTEVTGILLVIAGILILLLH